jgi:fumarylacetoacetase
MQCFLIDFLLLYYINMEQSSLKSWIEYDSSHPFPLENIPFGVFKFRGTSEHFSGCATRIGDYLINLTEMESKDYFKDIINSNNRVFANSNLNSFIALGRSVWKNFRLRIQEIFSNDSFKNDSNLCNSLVNLKSVRVDMLLPVTINDYTDFYSSRNHAFNMGKIIRGEKDALQPNWVHLPVGYHGRASTIVIDKTPIRRPRGQIKPPTSPDPIFSETKRLDYEVEVGVVIGKSNEMGHPIKLQNAEDHIFGFVLLNDWSARDVQTWEYIPLGPFNAKNFASTISPWIVTMEALEPFKVKLQPQEPQPLKYLYDPNLYSWDIPINVSVQTKNQKEGNIIAQTNYKYMYWTVKQQISHHTSTGCKLNVGDLLGSGTISGTDEGSYGCLFEMNVGGTKKVKVGEDERLWLEDGDYVNFSAVIKGEGFSIGFGDCGGEILPALPEEEYY